MFLHPGRERGQIQRPHNLENKNDKFTRVALGFYMGARGQHTILPKFQKNK